jgi:hypothetical protein
MAEKKYTFEDYLNCDLFDVHRWSDYPEVVAVRRRIMTELGFKGSKKEVNHVTVVLLNLYRTYCLDPDMWVMYSRDRNDYNYGTRYNKLFIKYDNMIKTVDGLLKLGYIEQAKGFGDRKTKIAFDSRMKATDRLIAIMRDEGGVTFNMIGQYGPDELVVLRNADGDPVDYTDTKDIKRMKAVLTKYNDLLSKTYIDIHFTAEDIRDLIEKRQQKVDKATGKPKDYRLSINLSNKRVRRIFNKSTFSQGGRFYGGWWQNIPSKLRRHIIINTDSTIEIDYSGLHIYMLYALKGINFADLKKEPYIYPKGQDPKNYRPILKLLLLAAVNSSSEDECIKAVRYEINMNRSDFPEELPDLKQAYSMFKGYHADIADLFCSKSGLKLQHWDSDIAEDIIRVMTEHDIPVLAVHDSFICPKPEEHFLEEVMFKVYERHAVKLGDKALTGLAEACIATKTDDITKELPVEQREGDIINNHLSWLGEPQARRFARYLEEDNPATNVIVKAYNDNITEVGFDLEGLDLKQCDYLIKEEDLTEVNAIAKEQLKLYKL